jgi:hypothetical protein
MSPESQGTDLKRTIDRHVLVAIPDQINQKHNQDGELHGDGEIAEDFPANFVAALSGQYPLVRAAGLSQSKSGRTSAPRLPQAPDVKRGSISESLTSSGHVLALIAPIATAEGSISR